MDLPFVEPDNEAQQSNELIRYDLTRVPTNVGENVPEELKPGYKPPPEPMDEISEVELEQELEEMASCLGREALGEECDIKSEESSALLNQAINLMGLLGVTYLYTIL